MAFTAVAALADAVATDAVVTTAMVMSAVGEVGVAMSVVGAVTGNKTLTEIGGVMSLGSSMVSLASGAGNVAANMVDPSMTDAATTAASDAATSTATNAATASTDATAATGDAAASTGGGGDVTSGPGAGGEGTLPSVAPDATQSMNMPAQSTNVAQDAATSNQLSDQTLGAQSVGTTPGPVGPAAPSATDAPVAGASSTGNDWSITGTPGSTGYKTPNLSDGATTDSGSFFSGMSNFVKNNKDILNLAGGALKGVQSQNQFDQTLALNQQRLALQQQQVNQTSYGNSVAGYNYNSNVRAPVVGQGIINGVRVA